MRRWNVGIIGCGNIADIYVINIQTYFQNLQIRSCAARHLEIARRLAEKYGIPHAMTVEEILADGEIDVVLNLTVPDVHYELNRRALLAGKHVYSEKPLAGNYEEVQELAKLAGQMGKRIGCAPDTWFGSGIQTCRKLLDEGAIGKVTSFSANMLRPGVEIWHPEPWSTYAKGAGPILDMGPYYVTALVALLGPVERVYAFSIRDEEKKRIYSKPHEGEFLPVEIDTVYQCILKFRSGVIGSLHMDGGSWESKLPKIEIHGTGGTLQVSDPNCFDGEIELYSGERILRETEDLEGLPRIRKIDRLPEWYTREEIPRAWQMETDNFRGIGLWDMMTAIAEGREHRNNSSLILHVMEVLCKLNAGEGNPDPVIHSDCRMPEMVSWKSFAEAEKHS